MGNASTSAKYISTTEAMEIMGANGYTSLKYKLESVLGGKQIDYDQFAILIQLKFEKIVSLVFDYLRFLGSNKTLLTACFFPYSPKFCASASIELLRQILVKK
jgi:hypothetical protein